MKKQLIILLTVCALCLPMLTGCGYYRTGATFSDAILEMSALEEMPLPTGENYGCKSNIADQETLAFYTDKQAFSAYVKTFADYMSGREDICYFGLRETDGLVAEMLPHWVVRPIEEGEAFDKSGYIFVYALSDATEERNSCGEPSYAGEVITVELTLGDAQKDGRRLGYMEIAKSSYSHCIDAAYFPAEPSALSLTEAEP